MRRGMCIGVGRGIGFRDLYLEEEMRSRCDWTLQGKTIWGISQVSTLR